MNHQQPVSGRIRRWHIAELARIEPAIARLKLCDMDTYRASFFTFGNGPNDQIKHAYPVGTGCSVICFLTAPQTDSDPPAYVNSQGKRC